MLPNIVKEILWSWHGRVVGGKRGENIRELPHYAFFTLLARTFSFRHYLASI